MFRDIMRVPNTRIVMEEFLEQYSPLLKQVHKIAKKNDCYLIARIQEKKAKTINVLNNKLESAGKSYVKGIGMRIFTKTGYSAFGSTDNIRNKNEVVKFLQKIIFSAKKAQKLNFAANKEIFKLKPTKDIVCPETEAGKKNVFYSSGKFF